VNFDDTPEEAAYRAQVRSYIESHRDQLISSGDSARREGDLTKARQSQRVMYEGGYVGITWPKEHGGQGGSPMQQAIVDQELGRAGVPGHVGLIGIGMCGPTVIGHGSEDQKQRYLKRLLSCEDIWCQLFSEPASGSDLAALRTKAVREGDSWRINGQKVWTTLAQYADYGILLTRTDPTLAKHKGLTMFVVDMKAPGVTVRPLRQMSGSAEFNEVFFDDVIIPDSERLGEVNDGWRVGLTTLMSERLTLGGGGGEMGISTSAATAYLSQQIKDLPEDRQALLRQDFGRVWTQLLATRYTGYRQLSAISKGALPGPEASAGKLAGTAASRKLADLGVRASGHQALWFDGPFQASQAGLPGLSIAGGTDEILRNVIGERVLGLPAEPRADKGLSFEESVKL